MFESSSIAEIRKTGKLGEGDSAFVNAAIANAGNVTRGVDLDKASFEELKALAHKAVNTAEFSQYSSLSGEKGVVNAYVDKLIEDSTKVDKEKGVAEGTNLRAFLSETREATKNIDFQAFHESPMGYMMQHGNEAAAVKKAIRKASREHINHNLRDENDKTGIKLEDDLAKQIQNSGKGTDKGITKDTVENKPEPMGGGIMQIIMMFIGMLLGVDLSSMFSGKQDDRSMDEMDKDKSVSPEQQSNVDRAQKNIKLAEIMQDSNISKDELTKVFSGAAVTKEQTAALKSMDDHVILVPNASGENPGDTVIYAKKGADGKLTDIQVATTGQDGTVSVKALDNTPDNNFVLNDNNQKELGGAITKAASERGRLVNNNEATVLADDIKVGLTGAVQKAKEIGGR